MGIPRWLSVVSDLIPTFIEWLKWIIDTKDKEFEYITKAWPTPIKTRVARLRYEAKRDEKFGGK